MDVGAFFQHPALTPAFADPGPPGFPDPDPDPDPQNPARHKCRAVPVLMPIPCLVYGVRSTVA